MKTQYLSPAIVSAELIEGAFPAIIGAAALGYVAGKAVKAVASVAGLAVASAVMNPTPMGVPAMAAAVTATKSLANPRPKSGLKSFSSKVNLE